MLATESNAQEVLNEKLFTYVKKNELNEVKMLLDKGANSNWQNYQGMVPLNVAVENFNIQLVLLLIKFGANSNFKDIEGNTALHKVCSHCSNSASDRVKALVITEKLITSKADVNVTNIFGIFPLHYALLKEHDQIFKLLLEKGADYEIAIPSLQKTFLHLAAEKGQLSFVNMLINIEANVDAQDILGNTPLHYVLSSSSTTNNRHIIAILLKAKANTNLLNEDRISALELALNTNIKYAEMLLKAGANPNSCINHYETGGTLLHEAVKQNSLHKVKILIDNKADVNAQDDLLNTPIHYAFSNYNENLGIYTALLSTKSANLSIPNNIGETPLDLAKNSSKQVFLKLASTIETATSSKIRNQCYQFSFNSVDNDLTDILGSEEFDPDAYAHLY